MSVRSKPGPFAEKKNAKSPAPPRIEIVIGVNTGAARNDRPPAQERKKDGLNGFEFLDLVRKIATFQKLTVAFQDCTFRLVLSPSR